MVGLEVEVLMSMWHHFFAVVVARRRLTLTFGSNP
jgi:hypothetical protein